MQSDVNTIQCVDCKVLYHEYSKLKDANTHCQICLAKKSSAFQQVKCNCGKQLNKTPLYYEGIYICRTCARNQNILPGVVCLACGKTIEVNDCSLDYFYNYAYDRVQCEWPIHQNCCTGRCKNILEYSGKPCGALKCKDICLECDMFEDYQIDSIAAYIAGHLSPQKFFEEEEQVTSSTSSTRVGVGNMSEVQSHTDPFYVIDVTLDANQMLPASSVKGLAVNKQLNCTAVPEVTPWIVNQPYDDGGITIPDGQVDLCEPIENYEIEEKEEYPRGFKIRAHNRPVYEFDYSWKKKMVKKVKNKVFEYKVNTSYVAEVICPPVMNGNASRPFATIGALMHHCLSLLHKDLDVVLVDNPFVVKGFEAISTRADVRSLVPRGEISKTGVGGLLSNGEGCAYGFVIDYPQSGKFSHGMDDLPFEFRLHNQVFCPHIKIGNLYLPVLKQTKSFVPIVTCNEFSLVRYIDAVAPDYTASLLDDVVGQFLGEDRVFVPDYEIAEFKAWVALKTRNHVTTQDLSLFMRRYYDKQGMDKNTTLKRMKVLLPYIMTDCDFEDRMRLAAARDAPTLLHNNTTNIDTILQNPFRNQLTYYIGQYGFVLPLLMFVCSSSRTFRSGFQNWFGFNLPKQTATVSGLMSIVMFMLRDRRSLSPNSLFSLKGIYQTACGALNTSMDYLNSKWLNKTRYARSVGGAIGDVARKCDDSFYRSNHYDILSILSILLVLINLNKLVKSLKGAAQLKVFPISKILIMVSWAYCLKNKTQLHFQGKDYTNYFFILFCVASASGPASISSLIGDFWSKLKNWWLNFTESSGYNRHVDCSVMGWAVGPAQGFNVSEGLTTVRPSAVYNVCNEGKDLVPFKDSKTVYRDGQQHCKAGPGVYMVMSVPARKMVSAARNCSHNREIGIINRGLADKKYSSVRQWQIMSQMLPLLLKDGKIRPAKFEKWISRFPAARQAQILKGKRMMGDNKWFQGDYIRSAMIKVEKQSWYEFGEVHQFDPRLIQGSTFKYQAATGPITYALTKGLSKYLHPRLIYACGMTGDRIGALFDEWMLRIENPILINGDFSRLDNTIRREAYEFEKAAYIRLGVAKKHLKALFKQRHLTRGVFKTGEFYQVPYTRCSGDGNTSVGNSLICGAVFFSYFSLIGANFVVFVMGDDTFSITDKYNQDEAVRFATKLGLVPKLKATRNKFKSEFLSARFWPSSMGTILGPKPGRLISRLGYTYRYVRPDQKYIFAKGVLLGLENNVAHIPIARTYVNRHLELFEGLKAEATRDYMQIKVDIKAEPTVETYSMAAYLYDTTIDGIKSAENLLSKIKHPSTVIENDIINKAIKTDYSASVLTTVRDLITCNVYVQSMFDGLWEEAFKRLHPAAAILLVVLEAFMKYSRGDTLQTICTVAAMHVVFMQFPYWLAVLIHCSWNIFAHDPCRFLITNWRSYRSEPVRTTCMEKPRRRNYASQRQPSAKVVQNTARTASKAPVSVEAVKAVVDSFVDTATSSTQTTQASRRKRQRKKSKGKQVLQKLPVKNIMAQNYGVSTRKNFATNTVANEYLTCLINPQVAANRGYLPKYPDRFDDKTTAQFAHVTIPELKTLSQTDVDSLTGPVIFDNIKGGYLGAHLVPNLTNPIRIVTIKTLPDEETASGYIDQQDGYYGIMSNTASPSSGMLSKTMIITDEFQQVSIPYTLDSQSDLVLPPLRVRTDAGDMFYGYPLLFQNLTFSVTIVPDSLLENYTDGPYKIYLQIQDYNGGNVVAGNTQVYYDISFATSVTPAVYTANHPIVFPIVLNTGGSFGINRWPGFSISIKTDAPTPITVTQMSLDIECGGTKWMGWEPHQLPALETYYTNYDKYRVVCMSGLLTNTSPTISQNGVVTSALIRGGQPVNFSGAYDPERLADFQGMYNGAAAYGTYVVWHPYDEVDMSFKDVSHVDEDLPFIMITANSADAAGNTPTFRLLMFMGLEATTHSQALSVSASPVNDDAVQLAYKIWKVRNYPTATSNDLHSFIMDVASKAVNTYNKTMEIYDRIPQPVKDFAWSTLLKGTGIAALAL